MRQDQHNDSAGRAARTIFRYPMSAAMRLPSAPERSTGKRCGGARIPARPGLSGRSSGTPFLLSDDGAVRRGRPGICAARLCPEPGVRCRSATTACVQLPGGVRRHRGRGGEHRSATIEPHDARGRRARPRPAGPLLTGAQLPGSSAKACARQLKNRRWTGSCTPCRMSRRHPRARPVDRCLAPPRALVADAILWVVLWILPVGPHVW